MANPEHLKILKQGVEVWNKWRKKNFDLKPDLIEAELIETNLNRASLSQADLSLANFIGAKLINANLNDANLIEADFRGADLSGANLRGVNLSEAELRVCNLSGADLTGADLYGVNLYQANLTKADLTGANLTGAKIIETNLTGANLTKANLERAQLIQTILSQANLTGCHIFGISAWELELERAIQTNLQITRKGEPVITVDNLEVAQFVYLLLNNEKIRDVIDTIGKKAVLILGRFTKERINVLYAVREELRKRDYLPILFDFEKPASKDLTETISTLAHMVRFIIADITEPKCVPHELANVVPTLSVPVKPLLLKGSTGEYAMFKDLRQKYHWVLAVYRYKSSDELIESLESKVIGPAEKKAKALIKRKNR